MKTEDYRLKKTRTMPVASTFFPISEYSIHTGREMIAAGLQ
jgi:hypothetical protein